MENKNLSRICPKCGKEIIYSSIKGYKYAIKHNSICYQCTLYQKGCSGYNSTNIPKYNLNILLNDSLISYYWIGFIIADGSFYKHRFELSVSEKDILHLLKFKNYINGPDLKFRETTKSYRLAFSNKESILKFMDFCKLSYYKTYNPCSINFIDNLNDDQKLALIIGIIDGDGTIQFNGSKNARVISIFAHKNWEHFYNKLLPNWSIKSIRNSNCIKCSIYKHEILLKFKEFINKYSIPVLERKWEKI